MKKCVRSQWAVGSNDFDGEKPIDSVKYVVFENSPVLVNSFVSEKIFEPENFCVPEKSDDSEKYKE